MRVGAALGSRAADAELGHSSTPLAAALLALLLLSSSAVLLCQIAAHRAATLPHCRDLIKP
jgi:hypothetical protein